jgi:hypothetical protein
MSTPPERTKGHAVISSACSPVSGWEISNSLMSTPASGIDRVQRMLGVHEGGGATLFLDLGYDMQRQGGLARGFRTVNLNHPATRQPANAQGDVQAQTAGGNGVGRQAQVTAAQLHHRALAERPVDLAQRGLERPLAIVILFLAHYPQSRLCHGLSPRYSTAPADPQANPAAVEEKRYMVCSF